MGLIRGGGEPSTSGRRHNSHARANRGADGSANMATCPVCGVLCFLTTDGNGRLKAYDDWPHSVHPHPEVLKGPGDPSEVIHPALKQTFSQTRNALSDDDILDIVYSTESPQFLAMKHNLRVMYIHDIQMGHYRPMPGVDYEATKIERDAARAERARQKTYELNQAKREAAQAGSE